MKRCIGVLCLLICIIVLASFNAESGETRSRVPESLRIQDSLSYTVPQVRPLVPDVMPSVPFLGSRFIGFREALAFKESGGDYFTTNTLGYLGKYQFGLSTLQLMGVHNATQFLADPQLQEQVFETNLSRNKWILRREIERFAGRRIGGVEVTESGILAAAHLAGAGNVKKYLKSGGADDAMDAYGSSISYYLRKFHGFDTSSITAVRNPRIEP